LPAIGAISYIFHKPEGKNKKYGLGRKKRKINLKVIKIIAKSIKKPLLFTRDMI